MYYILLGETKYIQLICFALLGMGFVIYIAFIIIDNFKIKKIDKDSKLNIALIIFISAMLISILFIYRESSIVDPIASIVGGGLTLIGVWWTINDQNNKRKEDIALMYRPILLFSDSETTTAKGFIYYENGLLYDNFYFTLKNLGRGEATNIKIDIKCDNANIHLDYNKTINMLCANERIKYTISIDTQYLNKFSMYRKIADNIYLKVKVNYQDFNNSNMEFNTNITLISVDYLNSCFRCEINPPEYK